MSKKKSYKVMPILAIVFYGVALILFLVKTGLFIAQNSISDGQLIVSPHLLNTFMFALPAACFIVHAAMRLKQSVKVKAALMIGLCVQAAAAAFFAIRLLVQNDDFRIFSREFAFTALFAGICVMCLGGLVMVLLKKSPRVFMIIAAACGILLALVLFVWNGMFMLSYATYYANNILVTVLRLGGYTVYTVGIIFYFIAFIFSACFRKQEKKA